MQFWVGKTLGNCLIEKWIGEGAMGGVYSAFHSGLQKKVAVKILHIAHILDDQAEKNKKRFLREAHCASQLEHPNIIKIYDIGEYENTYYMVMELLEGTNLLHYIESKGKLTVEESLNFLRQIASALEEAHKKDIIHRDIKPSNIMLLADGIVKLMDFGLARSMDDLNKISQTGEVIGTAFYISPEQITGREKSDYRCDFYALGISFFQMLTGKVPFQGRNTIQVIEQHLNSPLPDIKSYVDVSDTIVQLLDRLTAKNRAHRFRSANELLQLIETCQEELKVPPKSATPHAKSHKSVLLWGFLAGILVATGILFSWKFFTPNKPGITSSIPYKMQHLQFFEIMPENRSKVSNSTMDITGKIRGHIVGVKIAGKAVSFEKIADDVYTFHGQITLGDGHNPILIEGMLDQTNSVRHEIWLEKVSGQENSSNHFDFFGKIINSRNESVSHFLENQPIAIELSWIIYKTNHRAKQTLHVKAEGPANILPISKDLGFAKVGRDSIWETVSLDSWLPGHYTIQASMQVEETIKDITLYFTIESTSQHIEKIKIIPEKATLFPGQSIIFQAKAYNVYDQEILFQPSWIVSGGRLAENGTYTADNIPGNYFVQVRDKASWKQGQANIQILSSHEPIGWFEETMPPGMKCSETFGEYIWEKDQSTMVYVPPGEFWHSEDGEFVEKSLPGFYIDKYELTWQQYRKFCFETNHQAPNIPNDFIPQNNHPVVNISWNDAEKYAQWAEKKIPTQKEWEKSARGGFRIPDWNLEHAPIPLIINPYPKRTYPWGEFPPDHEGLFYCNYVAMEIWEHRGKDGYTYTSPVGSFLSGISPYGIHDMAGNVWEWCAEDAALHNLPEHKRYIRGGSWVNFSMSCKISYINTTDNENWSWVGVRFAK